MGGSINLANVALGFDASKVTRGVDLTAGEMRKLNGIFQGSISNVDKYTSEMAILEKTRNTGAMTADRLAQAEAALAAKYGVSTAAMQAAAQAIEAASQAKIKQANASKQAEAILAQTEREAIERQKKIDAELAIGLSLRKQVASAEEKLAADTKLYDQHLKNGIIDTQVYNRLLDQLKAKYGAVNQELNTNIRLTQREIDSQHRLAMSTTKANGSPQGGVGTGGLAMLGRAGVYGAAALGGSAVVGNSIGLAADIQATTLAFEVMTKSASKAQMVVSEMRKFDQQSRLGFAAIQQAGRGFLQYRIAAADVVPMLRQLGDITMGDTEKFKLMAYALGQVKGAGRLMGQEARQMTDAGFNPLAQMADEMAKKFGGLADTYMPELKKRMEDGKISFAEVTRAIGAATSAGGTFYGMTSRVSNETTKGAISNMRSEVSKLGASFGETLLPVANLTSRTVALTASIVAVPFNKWNEFVQSFDLSHLYAETKEMEKQVEVKKQFLQLTSKQYDQEKKVLYAKERADFDSQIKSIDEEYQKRMVGEERLSEIRLQNALTENAMVDGDKMRLEEALWKKEAIKQIDKAEKDKKEREDAQNKRVKDGEELGKATLNPLQEYEKELARIDELHSHGAINDDVMKKGKDKAGEKLIGQANAAEAKKNTLGVSQTIAPALKAGSVEAYKFMLGQKDKLYEAAQEQKQVTTETLGVAKQQLAAIENINRVGTRR